MPLEDNAEYLRRIALALQSLPATGPSSPVGAPAVYMYSGWSPLLRLQVSGGFLVLQVYDWIGGFGNKPAVGSYLSLTGLTDNIAFAVPVGIDGPASLTDGDKGDITISSGGAAFTINSGVVNTTTIANDAVTNAKLANMAEGTVKARLSAGTGDPEDVTLAALRTALAITAGSKTYARFSALDNQPPASAFATLDTRNSIAVLDFDDATDESAIFVNVMPEGAVLGSGLLIRLHLTATSATSGNSVWDVSLERMNTDLDSDSFDTVASATVAADATSGKPFYADITLTTIDGVTPRDGFRLKVTRNASNGSDNMSGDAELFLVEIMSAA